MKSVIKNSIRFLAVLIFGIILLPIYFILLPFAAISKIQAILSLRRFLKHEQGSIYFVCTGRRNWRDFLCNNVICELPRSYGVVWKKRDDNALFDHLYRSGIFAVQKPILLIVRPKGFVYKSLHTSLLEFKKSQRKISGSTQRACAEIVRQAESELRSQV